MDQRAGAERAHVEQAYDVGELIACIVIVRDAAGRRRHWIIDADGARGLSNRESNGSRPAEQDCRAARDRASTSGRCTRWLAPATGGLDPHIPPPPPLS